MVVVDGSVGVLWFGKLLTMLSRQPPNSEFLIKEMGGLSLEAFRDIIKMFSLFIHRGVYSLGRQV